MYKKEIPSGPGALSGLDFIIASLSSDFARGNHCIGVLGDPGSKRVKFGSGGGKRVDRNSCAFSSNVEHAVPSLSRRVGVRDAFFGFMRLNALNVSVPRVVSRYVVHISALALLITRL